MKEMLSVMADYNMKADEKMCGILKSLPEKDFTHPTGIYYPTFSAVLAHLAGASIRMAKVIDARFPVRAVKDSAYCALDMAAIRDRLAGDPYAPFAALSEADTLLVRTVDALTDGELRERIASKNMKGELVERPCWMMLLHILNHGTHHRGAVSAILDSMGIENDYSGLNLYTK